MAGLGLGSPYGNPGGGSLLLMMLQCRFEHLFILVWGFFIMRYYQGFRTGSVLGEASVGV